MKFAFGDIVVMEDDSIGVVVKCWRPSKTEKEHYEVYNRMYNMIQPMVLATDMERYMVRHKYISEEEKEYQYNALNDI